MDLPLILLRPKVAVVPSVLTEPATGSCPALNKMCISRTSSQVQPLTLGRLANPKPALESKVAVAVMLIQLCWMGQR